MMTGSSRDPLLLEDGDTMSSNTSGTPPPTYEIVMHEKKNAFVFNRIFVFTAFFFIICFFILYFYWKK